MEFVERIFLLAQSLLAVSDAFFDFMLKEWTIGTGVYTTYDILFGAGLIIVLTRICLLWIYQFLP